MKRLGGIYHQAVSLEALYEAFYRASKEKRGVKAVEEYRENLASHLSHLSESLRKEEYCFGDYHFFTIREPKERCIAAAPFEDRIVHHALMAACDEAFEKRFIADTYACRRGKGTHKALYKAQELCGEYGAFLKLDIRKYFDSIDHEILLSKLARLFKDKALLRSFEKIIQTYSVVEGKGLPIGNLTSQYFANYYLSFLDRFVKQGLGCKAYLRYMDDFVLFSHSREELKDWKREIEAFLERELSLTLKDKQRLNLSCRGIPFLGFVVQEEEFRLNRRSRKRFIRKIKFSQAQFDQGLLSEAEYSQSLESLCAFTSIADKAFQKAVMAKMK